MAGSQIFHK